MSFFTQFLLQLSQIALNITRKKMNWFFQVKKFFLPTPWQPNSKLVVEREGMNLSSPQFLTKFVLLTFNF